MEGIASTGSVGRFNLISKLVTFDWDFATAQDGSDLAGLHWYPARYIPQIPGTLLGYMTKVGDRVLDPFCGSGTTLLEARRLGRSALGIDTNPIACMIAASKLIPFDGPTYRQYQDQLCNEADRGLFEERFQGVRPEESHFVSAVPNREEQEKWYHPETLRELGAIWASIEAHPGTYQVVAQTCFSAILRTVCSQDRHWGWICDNVRPRTFEQRNAMEAFVGKLGQFAVGSARLQVEAARRSQGRTHGQAVTMGRCQDVLRDLPASCFDAVVTSPPYLSVTDYARSQRLSFLWFDLQLDRAKATESGARYRRFRALAQHEYLRDMSSSFTEIGRVLKGGRYCAVVFGQSSSRQDHAAEFEALLLKANFELVDRIERRIAAQRSLKPRLLIEKILMLRRAR